MKHSSVSARWNQNHNESNLFLPHSIAAKSKKVVRWSAKYIVCEKNCWYSCWISIWPLYSSFKSTPVVVGMKQFSRVVERSVVFCGHVVSTSCSADKVTCCCFVRLMQSVWKLPSSLILVAKLLVQMNIQGQNEIRVVFAQLSSPKQAGWTKGHIDPDNPCKSMF